LALLIASFAAGFCLILSTFVSDAGMSAKLYSDIFGAFLFVSLVIMVITAIPVIVLEIIGRRFGWRRGIIEPIAGATLGSLIIYSIYLSNSGVSDDRISINLILLLYAGSGALGGNVYYIVNKKLGNG